MKIKILNLNGRTTQQDVQVLLEVYGEVKSVRLISSGDPDSKNAIADMPSDEDADDAISDLNQKLFDGRVLELTPISQEEENLDDGYDTDWDEDESYGDAKKWEKIERKKPSRKSWQSN